MSKFCGNIGFATLEEPVNGVWVEQITERLYFGDLSKTARTLSSSENLNDNINIANEISILADPFANQNFYNMSYAEFMGAKWKITKVEVKYPRLILTVGGVYNDQ